MWFLWLNWCKSTFYILTAPNGSKCWPIVTSSIQDTRAGHQQLWRHNDRLFPRGYYGRFLSTKMRTVITAQWATENISCFIFYLILWPRASTRGIASSCYWPISFFKQPFYVNICPGNSLMPTDKPLNKPMLHTMTPYGDTNAHRVKGSEGYTMWNIIIW